jgi:hypothetical protein
MLLYQLTLCGSARPGGAAGRSHGAAGGGGRAHWGAAPAHRHHRGAAGTGLIKSGVRACVQFLLLVLIACLAWPSCVHCMTWPCASHTRCSPPRGSWLLSCMRGAVMLAQPRRCWQRTAGCSHARCAQPARRWSTPRCRYRAHSVRACKQPACCPVTLLAATAFDADAYLARRLLSMAWTITVLPLTCEECSLLAWCMPNRAALCCK